MNGGTLMEKTDPAGRAENGADEAGRNGDAAGGDGDWHGRPVADALAATGSDPDGLDPDEARSRLATHGPNALPEAPAEPAWRIVARQFASPLVWVLMAAAAIAGVLGEVVDSGVILAILVLNAGLGAVQEWRAQSALAALRAMLAPRTRVRRAGEVVEVPTRDLVPGDVVVLEAGDRVPADLRLLEAHRAQADEAALTGESVPVWKRHEPVAADAPLAERTSMAWMGTSLVSGRAEGVVVATGAGTRFGSVAGLTQSVESGRTPLQRKLGVLGRQLGLISVAVAILVAVVGMASGRPPSQMFFLGVSLAVAAVPEGLPAVVTLTLAFGVRAMAQRRALVRRLQAVEALGAATVICTDKTGTLTCNAMTLERVWTPDGVATLTGVGYDPGGTVEGPDDARAAAGGLLHSAVLCSDATVAERDGGWHPVGDPLEAALVVGAGKAGLDPRAEASRLAETPFDAQRRRMAVVAAAPAAPPELHVKGAPEAVLDACDRVLVDGRTVPLDAAARAMAADAYEDLMTAGLRVLGVARRAADGPDDLDEERLVLLGFVGLIDPPRPEVPAAVATARRAGIRVIMVTGDAPLTARAVAQQLGIDGQRVVTGQELHGMRNEELDEALAQGAVFARTAPEQKLRLVERLQSTGEVVAMTGDGVNDAPALKKADIGVAMGQRGTDVARRASEMVLTDDDFASIVEAVEEGRRQVDNIRRFVRYLLSSNTAEVVALLVALVLGGPILLLPVQILWMNLVTDSVTAVALGLEPAGRDVMDRPPRDPEAAILNRGGLGTIASLGLPMAAVTLLLFWIGGGAANLDHARTLAFTGLIVAEKVNVWNFRSMTLPVSSIGWTSNRALLWAWMGAIGVQVLAVYAPPLQQALHTVPLSAVDWLIIAAMALPIFVVPETLKVLRARRRAARAPAAGAVGA